MEDFKYLPPKFSYSMLDIVDYYQTVHIPIYINDSFQIAQEEPKQERRKEVSNHNESEGTYESESLAAPSQKLKRHSKTEDPNDALNLESRQNQLNQPILNDRTLSQTNHMSDEKEDNSMVQMKSKKKSKTDTIYDEMSEIQNEMDKTLREIEMIESKQSEAVDNVFKSESDVKSLLLAQRDVASAPYNVPRFANEHEKSFTNNTGDRLCTSLPIDTIRSATRQTDESGGDNSGDRL